MLLLVPQTKDEFPAQVRELLGHSLRLDKSPVADRCSLNFNLKIQ